MNPWACWLQHNGPGRFQLASKTGWDAFVNAAPRSDLEVLTRAEMARLDQDSLEDYNEARMVWNANLPTVKTHQLAAAFAILLSVVIRSTILQLATPDHMRGRVSSINSIFISSSNELGAFYAGSMARLLGLVNAVVLGGCVTLGIVAFTAWRVPALRRLDMRSLH